MRKIIVLILALVLVVGCGKPKTPADKIKDPAKASSVVGKGKPVGYYLAEGIRSLKASKLGDAIRNFDEAIKNDPLNPQGYMILGRVYMSMRNYDKAIDTFTAATRIAPENGEVYYMLSTALSLAGKKEAAIVRATQSVEMFRRVKDEDSFIKAMALLQGLSAEKKPDVMVQ